MIDIKTKFGHRVRELRRLNKISQEDFAATAKLHRTYISDVERGTKNISLENIKKIADAFQIDIGDLFL